MGGFLRLLEDELLVLDDDSKKQDDGGESGDKRLTIVSAHDSTLIGVMCALRLRREPEWPDYASYLRLEVLESEDDSRETFIRCSLNGKVLESDMGEEGKKCTIRLQAVKDLGGR